MQLNFTPEQEAKLESIAHRAGKPVEQFLTDAALNLLRENDRFLEAVENGIAAADRGEFIDEDEMDARVEKMLKS
jgi:predicted transcriptional regulator